MSRYGKASDRGAGGKGYKALGIYQLAHRLAVEIHQMTLSELPKFELYDEGSQVRRSAKAVSSNIVEGYGRRMYKNDYLRFLVYAVSSCDESKEHIELLTDTGSLTKERGEYFLRELQQLGRDLYFFVQSVAKDHRGGWKEGSDDYMVRETDGDPDPDSESQWKAWLQDHADFAEH